MKFVILFHTLIFLCTYALPPVEFTETHWLLIGFVQVLVYILCSWVFVRGRQVGRMDAIEIQIYRSLDDAIKDMNKERK